MKKTLFLLFILSLKLCVYSQSKKDVKKFKIKSVTEWVTKYNNGKETSYKEGCTLFNKKGKPIEEANFNPDGTVKSKETSIYDSNGNKIEETKTENAGGLKFKGFVRKTFKYNADNKKIEEATYNEAGQLQDRQVISYNLLGEKVQELEYDGAGTLIKKSIYEYDSKGLKMLKKVFGKDGNIEMLKKYVYEFQ